eukprot:6485656-Amphidinium_carterae.2
MAELFSTVVQNALPGTAASFEWRTPRFSAIAVDSIEKGNLFIASTINDSFLLVMGREREGATVVASMASGLSKLLTTVLSSTSEGSDRLLRISYREVLELCNALLVLTNISKETSILDEVLGENCKASIQVVKRLINQRPFWREASQRACDRVVAEKSYGPEIANFMTKLQNTGESIPMPDLHKCACRVVVWREGLGQGAKFFALLQFCVPIFKSPPSPPKECLASAVTGGTEAVETALAERLKAELEKLKTERPTPEECKEFATHMSNVAEVLGDGTWVDLAHSTKEIVTGIVETSCKEQLCSVVNKIRGAEGNHMEYVDPLKQAWRMLPTALETKLDKELRKHLVECVANIMTDSLGKLTKVFEKLDESASCLCSQHTEYAVVAADIVKVHALFERASADRALCAAIVDSVVPNNNLSSTALGQSLSTNFFSDICQPAAGKKNISLLYDVAKWTKRFAFAQHLVKFIATAQKLRIEGEVSAQVFVQLTSQAEQCKSYSSASSGDEWFSDSAITELQALVTSNTAAVQTSVTKKTLERLTQAKASLESWSGGLPDGASWKAKLPSKVGWEQVFQHAKTVGMTTNTEYAAKLKASFVAMKQDCTLLYI